MDNCFSNEIKNSTLDELVILKQSIVNYYTSKKLKNKNGDFIQMLHQIHSEIKTRRSNSGGNLEEIKKSELALEETSVNCQESLEETQLGCTEKCFESSEIAKLSQKNKLGIKFLTKKFSFSKDLADVDFPSFLNDKKEKMKEILIRKEKLKMDNKECNSPTRSN